MIKTRLMKLLSHAGKYIAYNVIWQWLALLLQIGVVAAVSGAIGSAAADLLPGALSGGDSSDALFGGLFFSGGFGIAEGGAFWGTLVFLVFAVAARYVCDRMAAHASYRASVDVKRILREKIYGKLLRLGVAYRDTIPTSEIVQMSGEGVEQLEIYFGKYLPQLFYSLLAPLTLFVVLSRVSLKASVVLLICVPLIPLSIVAVQKIAGRLFRKYWGYYADLGDIFLENLQGLTTLKIYEADGERAVRMDEASERFRKITMRVLTMQLNSTSVMDIVAYGGAAVGMAVAAGEYAAGSLSLAGTLAIVFLASEFFIPLRLLGSFFHIAMNGMSASDKIFRFLDTPEPLDGAADFPEGAASSADEAAGSAAFSAGEAAGGAAPFGATRGSAPAIRLENVDFSYEKDRKILDGVSLLAPPGALISLVGESGCGKSTIAGILSGKNKGYTGTAMIGNLPLSGIREAELLSHLTVVRHNSYIFKGTVAENLRMAKENASDAELAEALKRAALWEFLQERDGLATELSEQGGNLSGGQRQRLALARALLHDTPVYIFDEATSNIDAESEEAIMEAIRGLARRGRTVFLISHRLSNVVGSDWIYMLERGRIVESGTHGALMEKGGAYAALYTAQQELEQYGKGGGEDA